MNLCRNGLIAGVLLFGAGEALDGVSPVAGPAAQMGAVGVLAWVAWRLFTELREQRMQRAAELEAQLTRMERWEQARHEDSVRLAATLREMTEHCSRAAGARSRPRRAACPSKAKPSPPKAP